MAVKEEEAQRSKAPLVFGGVGLGVGISALVMALTRPARAAEGTPGAPMNVIVDGDVRKALAALLLQGEEISNSLVTTNAYLEEVIRTLGGTVPGVEIASLSPFQEQNETLTSGENYPLQEILGKKGALIWAIIDVTDPNTKVIFKFDDLAWEFEYNKLYNEGVDRPLFPGVWLSKYDAATNHYALIFSAGNLQGFTFKERMSIVIRFQGTGTAILTEGRGIVWTYT